MIAQEAKQRLEMIWKAYTSAYDTASIEDLMAFDMATNSLGAIEQIQWERDMAIKQLHDLGYGLGEKPREELNNSSQEVKKLSGLIERQKAIDLAHELIVPNEYKYGLYNQAINNYCVEIMQLPSAQPEPSEIARDIATIIENEKDMRVVLKKSELYDAAKRLNDLIFDINPTEICAQIEVDNLKQWCEIIQTQMKMAMVQLPCWAEKENR